MLEPGGEDHAKRAFESSRRRLGLDYLDLYLIHQPFGDYYSSWRAMRDRNDPCDTQPETMREVEQAVAMILGIDRQRSA